MDTQDSGWIGNNAFVEVTRMALRMHVLIEREKQGEATGPAAMVEIEMSSLEAADAVLTTMKELGTEDGDKLARRWGWSSVEELRGFVTPNAKLRRIN